ncbi:E3 ubiquitin-protein ligase SIAH2 [Trichoplax sp. H2]|uniref:E3 ubiquitin-protein ligase n=1 Tax=Trichoplax adhaerens TaxID=10228 RepID=B3RLR7_TRIAD|nr:hypothetical protein TRIADDRAFT_19965 [Trichoplax adhaerens]EDV28832.1 hypothetical protein TRIADDRAFT_19965 [Trichoplax adhaerens]RDD39161.1 E3 ubiquitin-protein ligase SIAH2 [Trichoplax sp. H2]|eukprot:XP_002108034.1 hypothetical protein TRIADDRAFT_19965 [Trichoplax adhaerens]
MDERSDAGLNEQTATDSHQNDEDSNYKQIKRKHEDNQSGDQFSSIINLFECPVCYDYVLPPIKQCTRGHLICEKCRLKILKCPVCNETFETDVRNLQMEKLARTLVFPCKFRQSGCQLCFSPDERKIHEDSCPFRIYSCPFPITCRWQGSLDSVVSHIVNSHKTVPMQDGEDVVFSFVITSEVTVWAMIQKCHDQHFLVLVRKIEMSHYIYQLYALVQVIAPKSIARNFAYVLTLKDEQRRLALESSPISINDCIDDAIAVRDCLSVDFVTAKSFSQDGNIRLLVAIKAI